jgi:hypothetical protein
MEFPDKRKMTVVIKGQSQTGQKQVQVRTGLSAKQGKLSEVEASSDRFESGTRKAVRSRAVFGQV